jgi:hypothetical protein
VAAPGLTGGLEYLFSVRLRPQQELPAPCLAPAVSHGACLLPPASQAGTTMARGPTLGRTPSNLPLKSRQGCDRDSGSDDFHFYTRRNPTIQAATLAVGATSSPDCPQTGHDVRGMTGILELS